MDNYLDDYLYDIADLCTDEPIDEVTVHKRWVYQRKRDKNGHPYGPSVKTAKWVTDDPNWRVVIDKETGNVKKKVRITATEHRRRRIARKQKGLFKWLSKSKLATKRANATRQAHYKDLDNVKNPIKNWSREQGHAPSQEEENQKKGPKLIHPKIKESFLMESPHVEFTEDCWWDFCAEAGFKDGSWLMQLIPIFNGDEVKSLRPDRNEGIILNLRSMSKEQIMNCLLSQVDFVNYAHYDFKMLSDENKEKLKYSIPEKLYNVLAYGR